MNTNSKLLSEKYPPLSPFDLRWIVMHIGMAIGAGIVFLPVKASLAGFWVFILASLFGYPAMYLFQRLYVQTLASAPECASFSDAVSSYLGKHWARLLSVLYLCMLLIWALVYTSAIVHDLSGYLQAYHISTVNLSDYPLFSFLVISGLILVGSLSQKWLFNLSGLMALSVLTLLGLMGLMMTNYWDIDNIGQMPNLRPLITDAIITLPFALTSILFLQSLSPMVVDYRKQEDNPTQATFKAQRTMRIAFFCLVIIVFFFAFSFLLAIKQTQAQAATEKNLSALAILAFYYPGNWVTIIGIVINLFAVFTSFFGVFIALKEALNGFLLNLNSGLTTQKSHQYWIYLGVFATLFGVTQSHFPILNFTLISSPLFAIVGCFMPVMLVYRIPQLVNYRGWLCYIVFLTGCLLVASPILECIK